jgi:hypothetical protein
MKTFYPLLTCLLFASISGQLKAQTILYSENFNTGTSATWSLNTGDLGSDSLTDNNYWIINNDYAGATPTIINTPAQPSAITGSPNSYYLHITNGSNNGEFISYDANYLAPSTGTQFTKMNTGINTSGYDSVALNFWYLCNGGGTSYYGRLYYSTNGGTTWILEGDYEGVKTWTNAVVTDSNFNNQADLRFAFEWVQLGGTVGTDPPWALDDISVTGNACGAKAHISASGPLKFCAGESVKLTVSPNSSYLWSTGQTTRSITVKTTGDYTVTVTGATGCRVESKTEKVTVNALPKVSITISGPSEFCVGDSVILTANNGSGYTYDWSTGATTRSITVKTTGDYIVTVSNRSGCSQASVPVQVTTENCGSPVGETDDKTGGDISTDAVAVGCGPGHLMTGIYPNPFNNEFHLQVHSTDSSNINIKVFDVNGRLVDEHINMAYSSNILLGNAYPSGFYIVEFQMGQTIQKLRVIKAE